MERDRETKDYFASTGAMHVLAVSGLHVGLIFFIIGFLLAPLKRIKVGMFLYPSLIILFLWSYALITGLSPSVQMATVMFSFIVIGGVLRRPVNIFNTLSASALVLILFNPEVIFEVGFQLSYLAVFGIVIIQPILSGIIEVKSKILKLLWDLLTVSVAAQLATFPLGLYYFNQFPNFFWLSNLFVIPGATIIIWITFAFFAFTPVPIISTFIAGVLQMITGAMLWLLKQISQMPYALSDGIILEKQDVFLIYGFLIAVLIYGFSKKKPWLYYSLVLIILFQVSSLMKNYKLFNQACIGVYNSKSPLIHLINGRSNYLVTSGIDSLEESDYRIVKNVVNHLKLEKPILINMKNSFFSNSVDLRMKPDYIQFLNFLLNISPSQSSDFKKFEAIELRLKSKINPCEDSIHTTILSGISYLQPKSDTTNLFLIKQKGAYFQSLN
jgi:competence protein ComEC